MNRRGFVAAILAAPLAVWGYFAGNHTSYQTAAISPSAEGTWVMLVGTEIKGQTCIMKLQASRDGKTWYDMEYEGKGEYSFRLEPAKGTLLAGEL